MANTKKYREKKQKGLAEIIKIGGGYALSIKRFSIDDGSELEPDIQSIDIRALENRKLELEQEIEDIDALILDVQSLG